jgi:hypothetical protein
MNSDKASTLDDLEKLGRGSIVRDADGIVWQRHAPNKWGVSYWYRTGSVAPFADDDIALPATILATGPG